MLVLLSPSKKIENTAPAWVKPTEPLFPKETKELVGVLKDFRPQEIQTLMHLSDKLAELNHQRYQHFEEDPTGPALYTFKGDVYDKMAIADYSAEDLKFAQKHVRILSGLYGLLRPLDAMTPYRLEMGTGLQTQKGKGLYTFWGDKITQKLTAEKPDVIINLASQEYFKAVQPKSLATQVLTVDFKHIKGGKAKTIGLIAKRARGLMADYIIKNRITNPEELKKFSAEDYAFVPEKSDTRTYTFILDMDK